MRTHFIKLLLIALIYFSRLSSSIAQNEHEFRNKFKGILKFTTVTDYSADGVNKRGEYIGKQIDDVITAKYNIKGKIIEKHGISYDNFHDTSWSKCFYKYYKDTLLVEKVSYDSTTTPEAYRRKYTRPDRYEYKFDTIRNLLMEEKEYEGKTYLLSGIKYKYDSMGNKIEESDYSAMEDGTNSLKLKSVTKYIFDSRNNKIEESEYVPIFDGSNDLKLKTTWRYRFDIRNNKIEEAEYMLDDGDTSKQKLASMKRWCFDTRNNEIEEHDYYNGEINIYGYDERNNMIKEIGFDKDSSMVWRKILEYDGEKNISREETFRYKQGKHEDEETSDLVKIYRYDNRNNMTEEWSIDKPLGDTLKNIYTYDSQNHLVDSKDFDKKGKLIHEDKNEYFYDEHGSCIKEVYYFEHNSISVTERKIEYYQ